MNQPFSASLPYAIIAVIIGMREGARWMLRDWVVQQWTGPWRATGSILGWCLVSGKSLRCELQCSAASRPWAESLRGSLSSPTSADHQHSLQGGGCGAAVPVPRTPAGTFFPGHELFLVPIARHVGLCAHPLWVARASHCPSTIAVVQLV